MGRLFLVRHAQASFLEANYDKLSATGEAQARLLGKFWTRHNVVIDRVCVGPRVRHGETEKIVREVYADWGVSYPEPVVMEQFDEFQGEAVLEKALPALLETNERIRELHGAVQKSSGPDERRKDFQRLFEAVITMWVNGEFAADGVESWEKFGARVNCGLTKFLSAGSGNETLAIFTSGGPVAVSVQRALHLSQQDTLNVAWMARNCSYSEFLFSGERFTLSTFNSFPHLDDPGMWTYR
jgi:broad specificity phosphatase PhoE